MASLSVHMVPGRLGLRKGLTKWHQCSWDGNRTWPHDTRVIVSLQCPAAWHHGGWDGNTARPNGTREAVMATGPGHMAPGWLGWQQGLATWHQGGLYGYIAR